MKRNRWHILAIVLFAVYLTMLVWLLLFKLQTDPAALGQIHQRSLNLIPFSEPLRINGQADWSEVWRNGAAFVPFGLYLPVVWPRGRFVHMAAVMGGASLAIELAQYGLAIGASDVTDLLMNTLGGITGVLLYRLLCRVLGARTPRVVTAAALACTLPGLCLAGLLIVSNL